MKKICFSVLMSVYYKDKAEQLRIAIDSIINQTVTPNEFIIIKDGPLNEKLDLILDEYAKKYKWIEIIELKKNIGLGGSLREGVKHCKYEYIARMDADDFSLPNRFEEQINYLNDNPDIDVLGGHILEFDEQLAKPISTRKVPLSENEIKDFIRGRTPFNHVTVIFKKDSVLKCGNYESMLYFEDYYLWCRMLKKGCKLLNMDKVLVNVRTGESFLKRRGGIEYVKAVINFERSIMKLGTIKKVECIKYCFIKIIVSISPSCIRKFIYMKRLRGIK